MASSVSYTYSSANSGLTAQQSALAYAANIAENTYTVAKDAGSSGTGTSSTTDIVYLSTQAQAALSSQTGATESFADVTANARTTLDENYAAMKADGKPFDYIHATQADWNKLFGSFDRRSLYAVASNSEGKFTPQEQDIAQSIMSQQEGAAMGLNNLTTFMADPSAGYLSGIKFMDGVSPEEKASANWMVQRAALQFSYEVNLKEGEVAENVDSGNPVVNMLVKAFQSMKDQPPRSVMNGGYVKSFDDLKNMPLFDNGYYASELQQATQQFQAQQTTQNSQPVGASS